MHQEGSFMYYIINWTFFLFTFFLFLVLFVLRKQKESKTKRTRKKKNDLLFELKKKENTGFGEN